MSFIFFNVLTSFRELAEAIYSFMKGDFFNEAVAAMHSYMGYMEQIIFDSSYLLRAATFLEDLS